MDAKSKANFINSVASGQKIICPGCGKENENDSKFCVSCGANLSPAPKAKAKPALAPTNEAEVVPSPKNVKYIEPISVFAQGLPAWDIVPPQVMVRRS